MSLAPFAGRVWPRGAPSRAAELAVLCRPRATTTPSTTLGRFWMNLQVGCDLEIGKTCWALVLLGSTRPRLARGARHDHLPRAGKAALTRRISLSASTHGLYRRQRTVELILRRRLNALKPVRTNARGEEKDICC